jgi:hypothetical protein
MSRPARHWGERIYGVFVALYPRDFRMRYGPAMRLAFRDMLEDSEMPAWRIWFSVLRDLRGSFLHEHLANVRGGISMGATGIVAGLARVAMLTVLIVTPVATGAVGYYLGRSQVSPVAEPAPLPLRSIYIQGQDNKPAPLPLRSIYIQGQDNKWVPIWTFQTGLQNSQVDVPALQRAMKDRIKDRTGETGPR